MSIDLEAAAIEAKAARARFASTAQELQDRVAPAKLIDDAVSGVKDGATSLAQTSVDAARKRPGVAAGIAAAGVALLLRKPIARLGRRIFGGGKETS